MNQLFVPSPEIKSAWKNYKHLWKREEAGARQMLLGEGDIGRKIYFIEKGCVRNWFLHDGKEISFQFFFEGDVVYSSDSFRHNTPSLFSIETIEPTTLRWLSQNDMTIIKKDLSLFTYIVEKAGDKQAEFMQHFFSYLRDTPKQRYDNLLRNKPEIIKRVPLQDIASYLGITPVSLSRIRNRR